MPGRQQREQVVEFDQVVLHGRRGEQKHESPLQRVDELPIQRRPILAVVGLVDDDQVPGLSRHERRALLEFHECQRGQHAVVPPPKFLSTRGDTLRRNSEFQVKFAAQFLVPLRNQRRGDQDQHAPRHAAQQILAEQQASFDGFSQSDLVRQQDPAVKMPQHLANGFDLMR